jgi:hypothetical protein
MATREQQVNQPGRAGPGDDHARYAQMIEAADREVFGDEQLDEMSAVEKGDRDDADDVDADFAGPGFDAAGKIPRIRRG